MSKKYDGTVKWFSQARGYGFIQGDNGYEYFVHIEAINSDGFQYLDEGDRVSFNVRPPYERAKGKAWRAVSVNLIEDDDYVCSPANGIPATGAQQISESSAALASPAASSSEEVSLHDGTDSPLPGATPDARALANEPVSPSVRHRKKNPFDRLPTRDPARFVGRTTEMRTAIEFVSDYRSLIISGAIGVGKSSLLNQMSEVLTRNAEAVAKHGIGDLLPAENIAVARHQCEDDNNLDHIRAGLISGLRRDFDEAGLDGWIKKGVKVVMKSAQWWSSGRVTVEAEENGTDAKGEQASQSKFFQFTEDLLKDRKRLKKIDGIVFIVDEVERLRGDVTLGAFVKAAREHFNNRGIKSISFVLCGAEGTASRIFAQHGSVRRLLEHLPLPGMNEAELRDIVATNLNAVGASIEQNAADIIVRLANHNPSRLIFLAGSAYEQDDDGIITRADCERAARKLISNLVKADFRNIIERESWTSTYKIMECVSDYEGTPLTAEIIAGITGLELNSTEAFCGILSSEGIFVSLDNKSEDKKKKYTFRDPIFALYFKLAREMGVQFEKDPQPTLFGGMAVDATGKGELGPVA